jgi:hypothetical protein
MKYVIVNKVGVELAILFPDQVQHVDAVNVVQCKPIAAGFVKQEVDGAAVCTGGSISLGLKSRSKEDAEAVALSLKLMGQQSEFGRGVGAKEQAI